MTGFPDMQASVGAAAYIVPPVEGITDATGAAPGCDPAGQHDAVDPLVAGFDADHDHRDRRSRAMNVLTNTWRQLVRRRLWPVAVLLAGGLVAVPVLLARDPEPVIPEPPAVSAPAQTAKTADDPLAEPVVAKATAADRGRRRRVLGSRKDPFAPDAVKHPKKAKKAAKKKAAPKTEDKSTTTRPRLRPRRRPRRPRRSRSPRPRRRRSTPRTR